MNGFRAPKGVPYHAALNQAQKQIRNAKSSEIEVASVEAAQTHLSGEFMINSVGESKVDVLFPVVFTQKPLITVGFELKEGEDYVDGFMPTGTGMVLRWNTKRKPPISQFFVGCTIGVVVTGEQHHKFIGIWHATGLALTDPVPNWQE